MGLLWPLLKLYFLSVCATGAVGLSVLEFFLGPRLGRISASGDASRSYLKYSDAERFVKNNNYSFESHTVTTEDGYILGLHRIPTNKTTKKCSKDHCHFRRPPVIFQHGLLAASDTWLFRGIGIDLPYVLADAGYDVWISNMRGNFYSRRHVKYNPDLDPDFWKFSLHEVGYYDLPATIDYVLNATRQKKVYVMGHSIGSSAFLILGALRPEYNLKIKLHLALAPLLYVKHEISLPHKLMTVPVPVLNQIAINQNILNVLPRRSHFSRIIELTCRDGMPLQHVCMMTVFALVGADYDMFNSSYFPQIATYYPAGTSIHLSMHAYQIYKEGNFRPYEFGDALINEEKYKRVSPEPYDLSLVTHPISFHFGPGDLLVTEEDINYSMKILPNVVGKFPVPFQKFNHMDFMWGQNASELLYNQLVVIMDKYR